MSSKLTGPDHRLNIGTVGFDRNPTRNSRGEEVYAESIRVRPPFYWKLPPRSRNRVSEGGRLFHRTTITEDVTAFDSYNRLHQYFFKWLRID